MTRPVALPRPACPRPWRLAAVLVLLAAAVPAPVAVARSIEIEDYAVDIRVDGSGGLGITETIRLRFAGQWNGIIRAVPIQNVTSRGEQRHLGFSLEAVTDEAGRALEVKRSRRGADVDLKIRVPGAADAVRTVVIRYRITGGLRFFDDHDELYWNVTGDEWAFPIHAARARIEMPAALVNVRVNAFTGPHGSAERAVRIRVDGVGQGPDDAFVPAGESPPPAAAAHVVEIDSLRPLGIREGLTAAVAWNPGVIRRPSAWMRAVTAWSSWLVGRTLVVAVMAAPLAAFLGMFWTWWRVGRDPRPGPRVVEYEPPDGLGPAEVGTLVDSRPDVRDIMAGLVDAAVKGVVRIRETVPRGWLTHAQHTFELLEPRSRWEQAGIPPSGRALLGGMFAAADGAAGGDGVIESVRSEHLAESFYVHLPKIRDTIYADLLGRRYYVSRPDTTMANYLAGGALAGLAVGAVGWLVLAQSAAGADGGGIALAVGLGVATFLAVAPFALLMPARTIAGARARDKVRGFEEFLRRVEQHRLESLPLTPDLFERFLPYAMALGVERRWARAFAGVCTQPPAWYVGDGPSDTFDPGGFTSRLGVMAAKTGEAMTSSPRSSGDSGFGSGFDGGGGGFSGGGDGGGGGSGW